jgi:hypothetical protein
MAGIKASGGIVAVSQRALSRALKGDLDMCAAEVVWLEDGQLDRLILACHQLADAAQAERNGRACKPERDR